jgi:uncharacterized phage protein gp47/JayE
VYGNGTVGIVFAEDGLAIAPPPARIAQMQTHLAQFTPVGSVVFVFAPALVPVNFTIALTPSNPTVQTNVLEELRDLLYREAAPQKTIPLTHVSESISSAQGEFDHTVTAAPLTFTGVAPVFQIGTLGAVTWI